MPSFAKAVLPNQLVLRRTQVLIEISTNAPQENLKFLCLKREIFVTSHGDKHCYRGNDADAHNTIKQSTLTTCN